MPLFLWCADRSGVCSGEDVCSVDQESRRGSVLNIDAHGEPAYFLTASDACCVNMRAWETPCMATNIFSYFAIAVWGWTHILGGRSLLGFSWPGNRLHLRSIGHASCQPSTITKNKWICSSRKSLDGTGSCLAFLSVSVPLIYGPLWQ